MVLDLETGLQRNIATLLKPSAALHLQEIVRIGGAASTAHGLQRAEPRAAAMETASSSMVGSP